MMTEAEAMELARDHAARYDIPWIDVVGARKNRSWIRKILGYSFDIDTGGAGTARVKISTQLRCVVWCDFSPADPDRFWLPPWAVSPLFERSGISWRMGSGGWYRFNWRKWYNGLAAERKLAYQDRFPEPRWGGWPGFYEDLHGNEPGGVAEESPATDSRRAVEDLNK